MDVIEPNDFKEVVDPINNGDQNRTSENVPMKHQPSFNGSFHHFRYIIITLGGMAVGVMFLTRLSITVAILSMVNHTHLYILEHPNTTVEDFFPPDYVEIGEFNWTNEIQQSIISGYMIGYTLPQVLTTRLSMVYGTRISISIGLSLCGLSCLLTPITAHLGWQWLLANRMLNGIGASAILPSMIGAIEKWMPYHDSALGLSLLQFVQTLLYASTPILSGLLTAIHWEWAFYIPGISAFLFAIFWWIIARDNPETCPFISQKELNIIKEVSDSSNSNNDSSVKPEKKPTKSDLPWYFMFKIKSFHFFVATWILYCSTFGGFLFLLPTYFHRVLKLSVEENGIANSIVQIGVLFSMLWPNPVTTFLQSRFKISLTSARRIVVFLYTIISILTWCYVAIFHKNQIIAICINRFFHMTNDTIITATLMSQFGRDGLSSLVYSMMNTFGNLSSVLFCWAVGKFLDIYGESLECWSWVLIVMSIMNLFLFLIYALFLDSEPVTIESSKKNTEGMRS